MYSVSTSTSGFMGNYQNKNSIRGFFGNLFTFKIKVEVYEKLAKT